MLSRALLVPCCAALLGPPTADAWAQGTGPTKRALIIAIGDYPADMGYARLHVDRDVELMQAALVTHGFDSSAVRLVRDAQATRPGILSALDTLVAESRAGDIVVVHYSGHGHRISDDNGDELDGFDEVLVPYGAPAAIRAAGYRGERHIRDEEFGTRLHQLRRAVGEGGSVVVLIDACFSGSATRGAPDEVSVRGVQEPIVVAAATLPRATSADSGSGLLDRSVSQRGAGESGAVGVARMVVISAARHDQVAREAYDERRRPVGSLSLAASRVLAGLQAGATYRHMFDQVGVAMAGMSLGDQSPQIEGDVDAEVFGGRLVRQAPYLRVVRVVSDSSVEVSGGMLLGVLPGTRVAFHPRGTTDPTTSAALATGTVREAVDTRATVVLQAGARSSTVREGWTFVTEYAYGDHSLRVALDPAIAVSTRMRIREVLSSISLAQVADTAPDLRIRSTGPARVAVYDAATAVRIAGPFTVSAQSWPDDLGSAVRSIARSQYLRRLQLTSAHLRVRMEVVPTKPRLSWSGDQPSCPGTAPTPLVTPPSAEGLVMSPRDEYTLRFVNEGTTPAYLVVLDLLPDGRISQLFPLPNALGADNVLAPGQRFLIQDTCFYAEEPYGTEVLKLFATRERVDFASVLSGAQPSTRSATNPLERLFADVYAGTRSDGVAAPPSLATTHSVTVTVVPRRPARRTGARTP